MPKDKSTSMDWLRTHAGYAGDDCLIWPFSRIGKGYGQLGGPNRRMQYAHRVMCTLVNGPPPKPKLQARHSCGRGRDGCVNPRHLSWGTNGQNQADRRLHGTHGGGIGPRTRLKPEQISEIRRLKGAESQLSIARRFGISVGSVEYWHKHNKPPVPPGTSRASAYSRQKRNEQKDEIARLRTALEKIAAHPDTNYEASFIAREALRKG